MSDNVKTAAGKVKNLGNKVGDIIYPLGVALPIAAPNISALFSGGPKALLDYNVEAIKSWRPPDWGTIEAYASGPGGAAFMTGLTARLVKWGIKTLGFSEEAGPLYMLIDGVENWGDGSAVGWAVKELVYPSVAGGGGTFSGVSFGGLGGQPAKGSPAEMRTKDQKPKVGLEWK